MEEKISVRSFVEFLMWEGDIDNRVRASSENAMREGARIHRRIQRMRGALYRAEVPLSYTFDTGRYLLTIDGRADGILTEGASFSKEKDDGQMSLFVSQADDDDTWDKVPLIEEIKGTYRNIAKMEAPLPVHLAQAKCYAYFFCLKEETDQVRIAMTYCNLDTEEIRSFTTRHTKEELETWFEEMRTRYLVWSDLRFDWEETRTRSIKDLTFPYAYRKGQRDLAEAVYRTIVHEKKLFLEAPTGSGKTLATLFPSVKAIGEKKAKRLFYLTARTITRRAPEEAIALMRERGLRFKIVTITAKEKICPNETCDCNPVSCPYAKGHYDRVNDALYDILCAETAYDRETISAYAAKHRVCPFEFSLDLSEFADGIICDYNYLFDPFVYLRRFFAEGEAAEHLFLIDEAHNLVERGREMYSAQLSAGALLSYLTLCAKVKRLSGVHLALEDVCLKMEELSRTFPVPEEGRRRGADAYVIVDECDALWESLKRLNRKLSDYLDSRTERLPRREEMLELYLMLFRFRTIYEGMDSRYTMYARMERGQGTKSASYVLRIFCVDPSGDLARCMAKGVSATLFSATMLPVQYYKRLLGGTSGDYEVYAETSFLPEKCAHLIVDDVTSRYTARGSETYAKIADAVHEVICARRGNYLVFFPSFAFLREVRQMYDARYMEETHRILVQTPEMTEEEREEFLSAFHVPAERDDAVTAFCVLGGIFAEGIDLTGEALIGAVIVGTGLPLLTSSRGVLSAYFDAAGENGFDYAYRFPGMNRVLQAAGRVIRTEQDTGVVVLLDDRFASAGYRSLFPREWRDVVTVGTDKVRQQLTDFWIRWKEPS